MNKKELKEFILECAIQFRDDTIQWYDLNYHKFYTTGNSLSKWNETSDNADDGFDISFAFHKSDEKIEDYIEKLLNNL